MAAAALAAFVIFAVPPLERVAETNRQQVAAQQAAEQEKREQEERRAEQARLEEEAKQLRQQEEREAMLFFALFSDNGPVNAALVSAGVLKEPFRFLSSIAGTRGLVALMNFLMWFGNTTILLMAAVMGIDLSLFEAAEIDGCTPSQIFWKITMPLIRPILVYVMITSLIGGLQMFDVPQILTNGKGNPDRCATTMIMYLNNHMFSKNYGMAGAVSVVLFLVCAVLCVIVYMALTKEDDGLSKAERKARRQAAKQVKGGKA